MTFDKLISIIEPVKTYGTAPEHVGKLTQNSREVGKGSVFIAVKGSRVDGHHFIDEAIAKGASVIICEAFFSEADNVSILQVEDTRSLAGPLAQAFQGNPAKALTIIGITGTNGKTTTATLVYQVLQALGVRASLLGTVDKRINNEVVESRLTTTGPIELAGDMRKMVDTGSTHLVMEVSSHALHQKRVEGIGFDIAAFTNLSHDHLDYHTSMDEYAETKKRLFDNLTQDNYAIINADDAQSSFIIKDCDARILSFGFEPNREIACTILENSANGLKLSVDGVEILSPLVGEFNAYNTAQAFLICRALGYEDEKIAQSLRTATGAPGRLERVQPEHAENKPTVLVDYAHTPGALENVLQTLAVFCNQNQILYVIFGCGGDRDKTKRPEMAHAVQKYADRIIITSDNPRNEDPDTIIDDAMPGFSHTDNVTRITDRRQAIEETIAQADASVLILIAGKGHETYQEVKGVRHHFDDREIAREALAKLNGNLNPQEVH